jgi:hypothetical protein
MLLLLLLLLLEPVNCSCLLLTAAAIAAGKPRLLQLLLLLRVTARDIAWPGPSMSSSVLSVESTMALESRSPTGITASCRHLPQIGCVRFTELGFIMGSSLSSTGVAFV